MTEVVACSLCGLDRKLYPDVALFKLGPAFICGRCAKQLATQAGEIEARAQAGSMLERQREAPGASMSDLVAGLSSSIRRDPDEWWTDGYRLFHGNGIQVWIANGRSYLKLTIPARGNFKPTCWQRRKIWKAVSLWRGRPLPEFWRYNPCRPEESEHRA